MLCMIAPLCLFSIWYRDVGICPFRFVTGTFIVFMGCLCNCTELSFHFYLLYYQKSGLSKVGSLNSDPMSDVTPEEVFDIQEILRAAESSEGLDPQVTHNAVVNSLQNILCTLFQFSSLSHVFDWYIYNTCIIICEFGDFMFSYMNVFCITYFKEVIPINYHVLDC